MSKVSHFGCKSGGGGSVSFVAKIVLKMKKPWGYCIYSEERKRRGQTTVALKKSQLERKTSKVTINSNLLNYTNFLSNLKLTHRTAKKKKKNPTTIRNSLLQSTVQMVPPLAVLCSRGGCGWWGQRERSQRSYSTKAKRFLRCPFYTKSSRLCHPPPGHNLYENPQKYGCAPEDP